MAALLDNTNHTIELITAGTDAMSNMFEVKITLPAGVVGSATPTTLRIRAEGFSPPVLNQGVYAVKYKTATLNRPNAAIEGERTFDITFRLDAYYTVYKTLKDWQKTYVNVYTGKASTNLDSIGTVEVKSFADTAVASNVSGKASSIIWTFSKVWIQKITEPEFTTENSDAQKITVTFYYAYATNPSDQ
jgi:hypothetical protein